jgi:ABC-type dipeptide/oligopeptide/nickel transport system permease subunit
VVIDDLDLLCMPFGPYEAKPPLAADPDAVLALSIMLQRLELIAWRNPKEVQSGGGMQLLQLPESNRLDVHKALHPPSFKQGLCIAATKTQDHDDMLTAPVMNRKPPFCAEALGFRTVTYRIVSSVLAALFATVAGALLALWLGYTGPDTTLSFEIMLDILLIVVIGGMGTLYGAVIGSVLFVLSVCYFPTGVVGRLRARVKTVKTDQARG